MSRRKPKGRDISGWLCLDKAVGQTSTACVASVKRLFDAQKVGHAGTLDPLASGALPIALGEATKTVPFVQDGAKLYRFTIRWGADTDSDDADGTVIATSDKRPSREAIEAALPAFTGEIMQRPPAFSAIKIGGERAYDLAREGETVELAERPVSIHRLRLLETTDPDHAVLEAECGKGTYVRSLARDLAHKLGTRGHVSALRRLAVGPFDETTMIPLEALITAREEGPATGLDRFLMPLGVALSALPEVVIPRNDLPRVMRGQAVLLRGAGVPAAADPVHATSGGRSIAIGAIERGEFHPRRVFKG
ncbi:MAG TPA: tRNA pseudouridine(55) synthase TruB [Bauldia sp.]|nr:tRNA pseudouridine(55) synthase TruB [Bauldia sp.]